MDAYDRSRTFSSSLRSTRNTARVLEQLRESAENDDVQTFGEVFIRTLALDPEKWLAIVRAHRLVEKFRSTAAIQQLRKHLSTSSAVAQLDKSMHAKVTNHLEVCEFMQEVFNTIDAQTTKAKPLNSSRVALFRAVIRMIEIGHWAFQGRALQELMREPISAPTPQKLAHFERQIRDLLDVGLIILNSTLAQDTDVAVGAVTDAELNRLIELAYLYEEIRQSFDLYTYGGGTARINRKSIIFKHADNEAAIATAVAAERIHDKDQTRLALMMRFETELRKILSSVPYNESFVHFLNGNRSLADKADNFIRVRSADYAFEISEHFDIASVVTTKWGTFSIRELIGGWAFLTYVAVAGQEWNGRKTQVDFKVNPIVEVPQGYLTVMLSRQLGVSHSQARAILRQFTTSAGSGRVDLFYKPLVQLDPRVLIVPTPFILGSRFDRNIFMIVVTEGDLDQKKKGFLPIHALGDKFRVAGFLSLTNYNVRIGGNLLTDIDLVAFKEGVLFLGQAKIVIEPDSAYDRWKAEQKLRHAAVQLRRCVEHLDDIRLELLRILGTSENIIKVVPFIITNTRQFTELHYDGYPVIDVPYLNFILGGARATVIDPTPGHPLVTRGKSFIKGDYPTAEELEGLIHSTIHRIQERGVKYKHELRTVGDRKVHLPMMGLRSPGESRMIFLDEPSKR